MIGRLLPTEELHLDLHLGKPVGIYREHFASLPPVAKLRISTCAPFRVFRDQYIVTTSFTDSFQLAEPIILDLISKHRSVILEENPCSGLTQESFVEAIEVGNRAAWVKSLSLLFKTRLRDCHHKVKGKKYSKMISDHPEYRSLSECMLEVVTPEEMFVFYRNLYNERVGVAKCWILRQRRQR